MTAVAALRPRRGRIMAIAVALVGLVIFGLVAALFPDWTPGDRLAMFGFGVLLALLMWRYASIRCDILDEGLRVRNLVLTTLVPWSDIEDVVFPEGDPWPKLLLADHEDLAVMAVQRSDGAFGQDQARRLARIIAEHRR